MLTIGRKNGITNREEPLATLLTNDISAKSLKEFFIAVKEKIVFRDKQLLVVTNGMAAISTNIKYLSADAQEVYSTTHMKQLLEHTANKSSKSNQRALDQIVKQIIEVAEADTKHDADTRWAQLLEQQHEKAYLKNLWNLRSRWCRSYIGNHSKQLDLSNAIVTCIHRKIEARRWFEWEHVYYLLKHMSQTYEEYAKTKSDIINKIVPRFVTITEYQQIQDINQNIIGLMQDPDINGDTYTVEDKENLYFVKFDSDDITCTCQKFHDTQSWCNHIVRVIYPENDNAKLSIRALDSDLAEPEYYSCVEYDSIFHYLNPYIDRLNKYKNEIKLLKEYYREKSEYLDRIQETRHLKRIFSEETQFLMKEIAQKKKEQNNISDPRSLIKRSRYYEDPHFSEEYPFF
ncbi:uncharacterized protein SPAPADRAFT_48782 [Spathaspora passalidarum NRRL Y-27907]|uniref:SWIM-type domain-containing protein n=1 Tax=Spathaspora passalidarum (strain NRRL Y-27907 / 11-Y1) TaxID=619300 RepID=G3AI84_SPAPN|nr:uncharacterized protein SPAPADRAFT_48782 [Spathaspora passalidarum NRRL Y-27907]EGW33653.1 hypothetical protein SPAPADRAFT_48782 [Spathaspora passalidarum NRRL Y-27907]